MQPAICGICARTHTSNHYHLAIRQRVATNGHSDSSKVNWHLTQFGHASGPNWRLRERGREMRSLGHVDLGKSESGRELLILVRAANRRESSRGI